MSDLSIGLQSNEKSYTFTIKYTSRFNNNKFFKSASETKLSWKVDILINRFKQIQTDK